MIPDADIPTADINEVIKQYEPLLFKIAGRYRHVLELFPDIDTDDLVQAGRMVIYRNQSKYDPAQSSFTNFIFDRCRAAMRHVIGYNQTGELPAVLESLDSAAPGTDDALLLDVLPDPAPGPEEIAADLDETERTAQMVREAVERLENQQHREIITRVWLNEEPRKEAAAVMGLPLQRLQTADRKAREKLMQDALLQELVMPSFHGGARAFNSTFTSPVEKAVLWLESHREILNRWKGTENAD